MEDIVDVEPLVASQVRELAAVAALDRRVGEPHPHNFVVMFGVGRPTLDGLHAWGEATAPLNQADALLLELCAQVVAEVDIADDARARLRMAVSRWRQFHTNGTNLVGCLYARQVALALAGVIDLAALAARRAPEAVRLLVEAPGPVKETVRINVGLPMGATAEALGLLLGRAGESPLLDHIDRIEVAKRLRPGADDRVPDFPTLLLYVGLDPARRPGAERLREILEHIAEVTDPLLGTGAAPGLEFAARWSPSVSVTQSFRLYKLYLHTVGRLDDVFDPSTAHALLRCDHALDAQFAAAVRSVLAGAAGSKDAPGWPPARSC